MSTTATTAGSLQFNIEAVRGVRRGGADTDVAFTSFCRRSPASEISVLGGTAVDLMEARTTCDTHVRPRSRAPRTELPDTAPEGWRRLHEGVRATWDLPLAGERA